MSSITFRIPTTQPFPFDQATQYLRGSPSRIVERVSERCYQRPMAVDGSPAVLTVEPLNEGVSDLKVTVRGEGVSADAEDGLRPVVERVFATRVNVRPLLDSMP